MTKVVHKLFLVSDYEKEERWLNDMAAQGYRLLKVGMGRYTFEEVQANETIRMIYMDNDKKEFIHFMQELDIEYVDSIANWGYFRKDTETGETFEMFSDNDSRIKHLGRILKMLLLIALMNLFIGYTNLSIGVAQHNDLSQLGSMLSFLIVGLMGIVCLKIYLDIRKLKENHHIQE